MIHRELLKNCQSFQFAIGKDRMEKRILSQRKWGCYLLKQISQNGQKFYVNTGKHGIERYVLSQSRGRVLKNFLGGCALRPPHYTTPQLIYRGHAAETVFFRCMNLKQMTRKIHCACPPPTPKAQFPPLIL